MFNYFRSIPDNQHLSFETFIFETGHAGGTGFKPKSTVFELPRPEFDLFSVLFYYFCDLRQNQVF